MTSVRLALQTALVLSLVGFVSSSDYLRVGRAAAASARANARQSASKNQLSQNRSREGLKAEIGYGSMSIRRATTAGSGARALHEKLYESGVRTRRERTPLSVLTLGGRVNGIIGQARTTLNSPVPFARLVLRDPTTGRVEARAVADENGQFTFLDITPSGYVVELIGPNDSVFATSEIVSVALGELKEAVVNLADTRQVLGTFGTLGSTASEPIAAANESGITALTAPDRSVSPQR